MIWNFDDWWVTGDWWRCELCIRGASVVVVGIIPVVVGSIAVGRGVLTWLAVLMSYPLPIPPQSIRFDTGWLPLYHSWLNFVIICMSGILCWFKVTVRGILCCWFQLVGGGRGGIGWWWWWWWWYWLVVDGGVLAGAAKSREMRWYW